MRTRILTIIVAVCLFSGAAFSLTMNESNKEILAYQIDVSRKLMEYIAEMFDTFGEGDMEASQALEKLSLWKNEYDKAVYPVLEEGVKLDELMEKFFSQIENYFIFYKRANRENTDINIKMVETRNELTREAARLSFMLGE